MSTPEGPIIRPLERVHLSQSRLETPFSSLEKEFSVDLEWQVNENENSVLNSNELDLAFRLGMLPPQATFKIVGGSKPLSLKKLVRVKNLTEILKEDAIKKLKKDKKESNRVVSFSSAARIENVFNWVDLKEEEEETEDQETRQRSRTTAVLPNLGEAMRGRELGCGF